MNMKYLTTGVWTAAFVCIQPTVAIENTVQPNNTNQPAVACNECGQYFQTEQLQQLLQIREQAREEELRSQIDLIRGVISGN